MILHGGTRVKKQPCHNWNCRETIATCNSAEKITFIGKLSRFDYRRTGHLNNPHAEQFSTETVQIPALKVARNNSAPNFLVNWFSTFLKFVTKICVKQRW